MGVACAVRVAASRTGEARRMGGGARGGIGSTMLLEGDMEPGSCRPAAGSVLAATTLSHPMHTVRHAHRVFWGSGEGGGYVRTFINREGCVEQRACASVSVSRTGGLGARWTVRGRRVGPLALQRRRRSHGPTLWAGCLWRGGWHGRQTRTQREGPEGGRARRLGPRSSFERERGGDSYRALRPLEL